MDHESLKLDVTLEVEVTDSLVAIDFLCDNVNLSKSRIKATMNAGAVWLVRKGQARKRLRRAMSDLKPGDLLEIFYDERLLSQKVAKPLLVEDNELYSLWYKPQGLLSQGTDWGDQHSLLRQVELHFTGKRPVYLIHRLDREAQGLLLVAHHRRAAALFSEMFAGDAVQKTYRVEVMGNLGAPGDQGQIDQPLDGKQALTLWRQMHYVAHKDHSVLEITLKTGRLHQIRRHFAAIGHPVLGDPKYGQGNKNSDGLKLIAIGLSFVCPLSQQQKRYSAADFLNLDR